MQYEDIRTHTAKATLYKVIFFTQGSNRGQ